MSDRDPEIESETEIGRSIEPMETGVDTGDVRANDPRDAGFTMHDRVFRSHFQHVNRLVDRSYEDVRPAYQLGFEAATRQAGQPAGQDFERVETDLENGWLNVRVNGGDWQTVRDYAREGFERGRALGFVASAESAGDATSPQRPPFADPVAENIDPTAPTSPENTEESGRE